MFSTNRAELQKAIEALKIWTDNNKMTVNLAKTKAIKFRKGGLHSKADVPFVFGNDRIDWERKYDYLGITLQTTLTFTDHVETKKKSALRIIGSLTNIHLLKIETALKLFTIKLTPP